MNLLSYLLLAQIASAAPVGSAISYGGWAILPEPEGIPPLRGNVTPQVESFVWTDPQRFVDPDGKSIKFQADLGYSGVVSGKSFWVYGDTFIDGFPASVDSSGIGHLDDPSLITLNNFKPDGYTNQLIPNTKAEDESLANHTEYNYGYGGTNIVETILGTGIIYYLKILRSANTTEVMGAGLASFKLNWNGTIKSTHRNGETMWNATEPAWGDIGATRDDTHVYLWGHGPGELGNHGYMARVEIGEEKDVDAYEYWNNATLTWSATRLGDGQNGTRAVTADMAIWGANEMFQGAPFWNAHYRLWMWLYGDESPGSNVLLATAPHVRGPWKRWGVVASSVSPNQGNTTGLKYGINGHPEYDVTGRTTLVTWVVNNLVLGTVLTWA